MNQPVDIAYPHASGKAVRTLPEAFQATAAMHPEKVALRTPGDIQTVTWREYAERVEKIASGLAAIGVGPRDTVGIMLTNRPEFHLVDTAVLHLGAIPFSIYNTSSPDQISYLFGNAENRLVITELAFLAAIQAADTHVEQIITVDGPATDTVTLADIEANPKQDFDFAASWHAVQPSDLATLIYTSGTTGPPKGVEISHLNLIAEGVALHPIFEADFDDRIASYLPAAHIADRASAHGLNMIAGIQITSVADPREIAAALPDTRPTVFFGVPRVWQKIKAGIEAKLAAEESPVKKALANWSLGVAKQYAARKVAGKSVSLPLQLQHRVADTLVLSKVRHALGFDQIKIASCGAAATPAEVLEFFLGLGIEINEVWGMSETTGATTSTLPGDLAFGTVGRPVEGVEVKLADDGELLVRGPMIMPGYRKLPEKTAETIDSDGWLATGDIAEIDDRGFVTIVDRKKELIINAAGKNMSPTNIENAMKGASSLIGQVAAIGDAQPYIAALIVLDPDAAAVRAKALGIPEADMATLVGHLEIRDEVKRAVKDGNTKLSQVEQIKRFIIVPQAWDPGGEELTPTMKLRRKPIAEKYAGEIDALYADPTDDRVIDMSRS
ncbi:long-chain fatty acid--CoA ligase [Aldersonia sp. NBC_00410]|uniref:AMP-dependent synthetase/ligase n=1 Tax=Aldersonia sp. NBC_00410 TaxID=2975954 RepID=UPI002256B785|nr:long-chain fatty acid--CoA ligase [Aldersonia sp. NBC_00410]MCX5045875.1 long-chain fatty acid--CoA ligase [Aldersonia sp. NBC_00410]